MAAMAAQRVSHLVSCHNAKGHGHGRLVVRLWLARLSAVASARLGDCPDKSKPAHKTFFKGRLVEPAAVNKQLTIEIFGENRTLISESVAQIDAS